MTQYDNSGTLSNNGNKSEAKQPDVRGKCTINGTEYRISGWWKNGRNGQFLSLNFQVKDQEYQGAPQFAPPQPQQQFGPPQGYQAPQEPQQQTWGPPQQQQNFATPQQQGFSPPQQQGFQQQDEETPF